MSKEIEKKQENVDLENREKVELIKRMFAKGATNDEFQVFLELAKRYNLDPFKRQIFFLPDRRQNEPGKIMVSHAGLIHIAHSSDKWAGMKTYIISKDGEEQLIVDNPDDIAGAVCYVYRKDWKEPLIHAVSYREYFKANNSHAGPWYSMPQTMIKKVAEAGALRRAFDLGGLYIEEEMDTYTVYDEQEENIEEGEEKEIKQKNVSQNSTYLVRLMAIIDAAEKRYNLNKKKTIKYLEKTFNKKLEEFSNEDLKQSEQIIKKIIEKNQEKVEKDEIKKIEVKVEEPVNENDEIKEWQKKLEETFADLDE